MYQTEIRIKGKMSPNWFEELQVQDNLRNETILLGENRGKSGRNSKALAAKNRLKPRDTFTAWVDPRLVTGPSPIGGSGLFANAPIQTGEIVMTWGGTVFSRAEILAGKANPETIAVVEEGLYLADPAGTQQADEYPLNHSCDPNIWMLDARTLIARRPIALNEEVTADYALWLFEQDWVLDPCRCGSSLCRGRVTDQDWKLPELQIRYAGHFTPFLNRLIERGR